MRVLKIVEGTSVDGPGLRTSIYLSGCDHHCPGCHNPQSWDPMGGTEYTDDELLRIVAENEAPVTFSGGDPLREPHEVARLAQRIKQELGYNLWCFTGFTWEEILASPDRLAAARLMDVVVEGRFVQALRDTSLLFRGSSNQRLIDVPRSLAAGTPVLWSVS